VRQDFRQFMGSMTKRPEPLFLARKAAFGMVALKRWKSFKKAGLQEALDYESAQVHRSVGTGVLPGLSKGLRIIETAFRDCSELRWAQSHFFKDACHNQTTRSNDIYLNVRAGGNQE
jgi:hypothetical protein